MPIYPEDQVGENFFDVYYQPFKRQIWAAGILFAVIALTVLGIRHYRVTREDDQWTRYHAAVGAVGTGESDAAERLRLLRRLITDYPEDSVTPFAMAAVANEQRTAEDYDGAIQTLSDLETAFPDFALNTLSSTATEGGTSLSRRLRDVLASEKAWAASTRYEHVWPDGRRAALIETTLGSFWIGFYAEQAPEQVANFVRHAKAGDYNGTQIYEVRASTDGAPQLFRGGSRASKTERDPALHDRDEPLHTSEPGPSRYSIKHLRRVVSTVEMSSGDSDQRFMIISAEAPVARYDGRNSPFAAVLELEGSIDVMDRIANATTYETNPTTAGQTGTFKMRDHPYPAVRIRRVTIWQDEKLEDGHAWDTARKASEEPEPWEATLPPDPTPDDLSGAPDDGDDGDDAGDPDDTDDTDDSGDDDGE